MIILFIPGMQCTVELLPVLWAGKLNQSQFTHKSTSVHFAVHRTIYYSHKQ